MRIFLVTILLVIPLCAGIATETRLDRLEEDLYEVTRQLLLSNLYTEEATRSSGQSGLKQIRVVKDGTKPYHSPHYSGSVQGIASIHNHPNHYNTVGMGEFAAVLNGVEFRTRHNDYMLRKPHTTDPGFHKTEEIPYPDVPEEVTDLDTVEEQIQEMREWFHAFHTHNETHRPYKPYFKPVLCYLEGAWTNPDGVYSDFESDRHFLDALNWFDMEEKIRFTSYGGHKNPGENYAQMPRKIVDIVNGTKPVIAQWNYRILCHPLETYVDPSDMRLVDDLGPRMAVKKPYIKTYLHRSARFQLHSINKWNQVDYGYNYNQLDKLMSEIPGKDNYPGFVDDNFLGQKYDVITGEPLDAGRYHRYYMSYRKGAMGSRSRHRGFSDPNLFVAFNTQENIPGLKLEHCVQGDECTSYHQKASYAIPLEIVYMTPLANWNPYNIEYKGDAESEFGQSVLDGPPGVLNGTNSAYFFRTPATFFNQLDKTSADTTGSGTTVLDMEGNERVTKASGQYIHLPHLPDIGWVRLRYPIMPVHAEGSAFWRELAALAEQVENGNNLKWLLRGSPEENMF